MKVYPSTFRHRFKRTIGMSLFLFFALFVTAPSVAAPPAPVDDLDRSLTERAEQYLESLRRQTTGLSAETRERAEQQARKVIKKGFALVGRRGELVRKQAFEGTNFTETAGILIRLDAPVDSGLTLALDFLGRNFHQPSEWEVTVRVALPSRFEWERIHGVLAQHFPAGNALFGGLGIGHDRGAAIVLPSTSRASGAFAPDRPVDVVNVFAPDVFASRFAENENLLTGFPLIARTVVLRI